MSVGWLLWCWHDKTSAGDGTFREQFPSDHAAAVVSAVWRAISGGMAGTFSFWCWRKANEE
jgi:hypothetical protein